MSDDSKTIYETKVYQVKGRKEVLVDHPANWGTPDREESLKIFEAAARLPKWRKNSAYVIRLTEVEHRGGFVYHRPYSQLRLNREL